jgi:hypothetical protein
VGNPTGEGGTTTSGGISNSKERRLFKGDRPEVPEGPDIFPMMPVVTISGRRLANSWSQSLNYILSIHSHHSAYRLNKNKKLVKKPAKKYDASLLRL